MSQTVSMGNKQNVPFDLSSLVSFTLSLCLAMSLSLSVSHTRTHTYTHTHTHVPNPHRENQNPVFSLNIFSQQCEHSGNLQGQNFTQSIKSSFHINGFSLFEAHCFTFAKFLCELYCFFFVCFFLFRKRTWLT